jgi:2,4-dienoyl-CoA reductase-like NADH-dependent reductase (Old Yellow Enzyme family)
MGPYVDDRVIGERTIAFYRRRAQGGVGMITFENVFVSRGLEGTEFRLYDKEHVRQLRRVVDAVHAEGAVIGVQLVQPGRDRGGDPVAPSPVVMRPGGPVPRELGVEEIRRLVGDFGRAAALGREAGFDYAEVHGAHGFVVSDFLAPVVNRRNDDYGGDSLRRARFAIEIVEAMRAAAGDD